MADGSGSSPGGGPERGTASTGARPGAGADLRSRLERLVVQLEERTRRPTDDAAAGARKVHFILALTTLAGLAAV